jgi:hypothetical protein
VNPVKGLAEAWKQRREIAAELREERDKEVIEAHRAKKAFESLHRLRLDKAAGVSSMQIVCHEDTWTFVEQTVFPVMGYHIAYYGMVEHEVFPRDRVTNSGNGMVTVTLSGRHLVRSLTIFRAILAVGRNHFSTDVQQFAMANRLYDLLSEVVDEVDTDSASGGIPRLVVDAGLEEDKPED